MSHFQSALKRAIILLPIARINTLRLYETGKSSQAEMVHTDTLKLVVTIEPNLSTSIEMIRAG